MGLARESSSLSPSTKKMKKGAAKILKFIKSHKIAVIISGFILLVAILLIPKRVISYLKGPIEQYETAKVKKQDLSQTISASGKTQAENQAILKFQTSGKLTWVGVKEGDKVKKWQAIASLDKRELEKKFKKELNDYMNERWDFEQTQEDYKETKERHLVTDAIKRILEKAQFDLNNVVIDLEIADLAVKFATITSPIDGIVIDIESPVAGVNITPATARFTIADPSMMKFVANVDESDIGRVRIGQKVIISLDAYPEEEFEGEVSKIAFASITTRGGGTAFPVDITLPENIEQRFKVEMNGDVEIIIASGEEVLTVPNEAIKRKAGKTYAQIIEKKEVKEVEVEVGIENGTKTEILKGLSEGQIVITDKKKE